MGLEELHDAIRKCRKCHLYKYRKNAVPGEGSAKLGVMLVGEAPGASEDEQGRPFVGAAGNILTETLSQLSVSRLDLYITNVVKCRPPGNRTPTAEEVEICLPYLVKEIAEIKPKRIVALGLTSAKTLLRLIGRKAARLGEVRGQCFSGNLLGRQVEICVTYHPAAALRTPSLLQHFRNDLAAYLRDIS